MTGGWKKFWTAALTGIVVAGVVVACSSDPEHSLAGPMSGGTGGLPMFTPPPGHNLGTKFCVDTAGRVDTTGIVLVACTELWGTRTNLNVDPTHPDSETFTCLGIGRVHGVGPNARLHAPNDGHSFYAWATPRPGLVAVQHALDYTIKLVAHRPIASSDTIRIGCGITDSIGPPSGGNLWKWIGFPVDSLRDTTVVITVTGTAPVFDTVKMVPPQNWVVIAQSLQLGFNFLDSYHDSLPADTATSVTWSSDGPPFFATVNSTGLVGGVARGTATITASGTYHGVQKTTTLPIAVEGCTSVGLSPSGTLNIYKGVLGTTITATPTCDTHVNATTMPVFWTALTPDKVSISAGGTGNHVGTITTIDTGTTIVRACATFPSSGPCSTLTVNVILPPALSVTLEPTGQTSVRPSATCEWIANRTGGVAPYTYTWPSGATITGDPWDIYYTNGKLSFTMSVTVTDAAQQSVTANKSVTVSSGAPYCPV